MSNNWHNKSIDKVFEILSSGERGLNAQDAKKRIKEYGSNKLPEGKTDSIFVIFLRQFQSPLIYVLLAAAVIVFFMDEMIDTVVILAVLLFNAVIGTIQEGKARNTLLSLKKFTETSATVLRDGKEIIISDQELVPGDVVILQEGEKVPADARIVFSNNLKIDQASLTGESSPVLKEESVLEKENTSIVEQKNMVFKGTYVMSGNGVAVIVSTGTKTQIGKIAEKIVAIDVEIPLKKNIRYLSRLILFVTFISSLILIVIGFFTGHTLKEMFMTVITLSVSVIPEGLPVVITIVLAAGVWRMSKKNTLVKRLQAVESLGQTEIIAVDKTGTLTKNEMVVQKIYINDSFFEVNGVGYNPEGEILHNGKIVEPLNHQELVLAGKVSAFCSNARISYLENVGNWKVAGDPTEAAMLVLAEKIGFNQDALEQESPKIFEIPFDFHKKYHAVIRRFEGKNLLAVMGAPEEVLDLCQNLYFKGKNKKITKEKRDELKKVFYQMADKGFRVVAFAINKNSKREVNPNNLLKLTFGGYLGMKDALRVEVKDSIKKVMNAGMKTVMITGDHKFTAQAIAKEAGIYKEGDLVLTGQEIDEMSDEILSKKIIGTSVFARVDPNHKLRIIEAYRKKNITVAMTGDGINDAPSLVAADLGVAMGKIGTEVAKEASDIILLDDNFANIVFAAEEGRNIYKTIKKATVYLLSTSLGEVLSILVALALGFPLPLLPTQIIWLNFVTDGFLTIALALEPREEGLMDEKFVKPKKYLIDKGMGFRMFLMGGVMMLGTIWLFKQYLDNGDMVKAWTISLTILAVFQWFNVWNCRSEEKSIFKTNPFSNKFLIISMVAVILAQIAAVYMPFFQRILKTSPLTLREWGIIILISSSIVILEELRKLFYRYYKIFFQRSKKIATK